VTLIRHGRGPNPLRGFRLEAAAIDFVGRDLQRPECILAEADGTLWTADARGGVMRIAADGRQSLILQAGAGEHIPAGNLIDGTLPNGLALASDGDLLIANFGTDRIERMVRDGATRVVLDAIDGRRLGKVNFLLRDRRDRLWFTISTMVNPWTDAIRPGLADGAIGLIDELGKARIVADGFHFTNEIRLDADEQWLYVAETTAKRISRLRVAADGSLGPRETFGPTDLGAGLVDGICFDAYGNLWATMIFADRLIAITPDGERLDLFEDGDVQATASFETAFASGAPVPAEILLACGGPTGNLMTSITFGGEDLRDVYLGSLRASSLPHFRSPVPGLAMAHWNRPGRTGIADQAVRPSTANEVEREGGS
jgi:gluconolactonase